MEVEYLRQLYFCQDELSRAHTVTIICACDVLVLAKLHHFEGCGVGKNITELNTCPGRS